MIDQTEEPRLLLTIAQAAKRACVGKSLAYRLAHSEWVTVRIGRALRVNAKHLDHWIEANSSLKLDGFQGSLSSHIGLKKHGKAQQ